MVLIVQVWVSLFVGLMCIVWVAAVVLPFVFLEGKAARPAEGPSVTDVLQVQNLQEAGFLYSYYPRYSEKESAYRFDLAYPFTLLATYVIGLLVLVRYSLKGFPAFPLQDKKAAPGFLSLFGLFSIDRKNQKKFSNATFSSWNFNLVSIETSRQYRRGMRQKFQIMLQEAALEKNKVDIQMFNALKGQNILLFFTSVLVWPFMVGAVAIGVNYVITEMESIEDGIGIKYAPAVAIWAIMKASSAFNRALLGIEKWPKSFRYLYQLRFARFFFTRAFGLGSLVYHMYHNIKFQEDFTTPGNPFGQTCPEQVFGEFLYRLAIANLVCECFLCSLYIIIRRNMGKAVTLNVEESLAEAAFLLGLFLSGVLLAPYIGFIIAFQVSSFFRPASTFAAMCSWPDVPPPRRADFRPIQVQQIRPAEALQGPELRDRVPVLVPLVLADQGDAHRGLGHLQLSCRLLHVRKAPELRAPHGIHRGADCLCVGGREPHLRKDFAEVGLPPTAPAELRRDLRNGHAFHEDEAEGVQAEQ